MQGPILERYALPSSPHVYNTSSPTHGAFLAATGKEQHPAATTRGHAHRRISPRLPSRSSHPRHRAGLHSLARSLSGPSIRMPLHRFAPFNASLRSKPNPAHAASISTPDLGPYTPACLGASNARRLLKRSQLSKAATREAEDELETMYHTQEESTLEAAAAIHFDSQPIGYSVQCYATHAEDAARRQEAAVTEQEKLILFHSINSSRHAEGQAPLRIKPSLSKCAQDHADAISSHTSSSIPNYLTTTNSRTNTHPNSVVVVMAPSGSRVARLVSPPRMGALTCGELWYGGKYRRHLYDMSGKASTQHSHDCPCHLRMVFETMVDEGWRAMGIGRGGDGRWVVELGQ